MGAVAQVRGGAGRIMFLGVRPQAEGAGGGVVQAVERVGDVSTRPLFKNLETARQTIAGRLPMYEDVASVSIDTVGKSINVVAQEIQEILEKEGVLCLRQG